MNICMAGRKFPTSVALCGRHCDHRKWLLAPSDFKDCSSFSSGYMPLVSCLKENWHIRHHNIQEVLCIS